MLKTTIKQGLDKWWFLCFKQKIFKYLRGNNGFEKEPLINLCKDGELIFYVMDTGDVWTILMKKIN